ncbi:peptidoglycan-binding protein [Streptomyces sp. NPDC053792]|uniref:peptidoglycan-binding protein n=1 Tax=Streptomyces sp. NPDC053792 TaxID=3365716 RepID=UPI0037D2C947
MRRHVVDHLVAPPRARGVPARGPRRAACAHRPGHALAGASVPTQSKGSRGSDVTALQYLLNGQGAQLAADGVFGAGTDTAVRSFQSSRGLDADGIVGPDTWWALVTGSSGGSGGLQAGLRRDQLPQHLGHRHVRPLRHPR